MVQRLKPADVVTVEVHPMIRDDCPTAFALDRREILAGGLALVGGLGLATPTGRFGGRGHRMVRRIRSPLHGTFVAAGSPPPQRGSWEAHRRGDERIESLARGAGDRASCHCKKKERADRRGLLPRTCRRVHSRRPLSRLFPLGISASSPTLPMPRCSPTRMRSCTSRQRTS